jgi:hypothetical protein
MSLSKRNFGSPDRRSAVTSLACVAVLAITVWLGSTGQSLAQQPVGKLAVTAPGRADVDTVLARMRDHAGTRVLLSRKKDTIFRGQARIHGADAEYSLRFTTDGKYLQKTGGALGETYGSNGGRAWMVNSTGIARSVELFDRDLHALLIGLETGLWLAHATKTNVAVAAEQNGDQLLGLYVQEGRLRAKLMVNRSTWLPEQLHIPGAQTWTFTDYRHDLGWEVPAQVQHQAGAGIVNTYAVQSVTDSGPTQANIFNPVLSAPRDMTCHAALSSTIQVRRARTGHVLVQPRIDGADLGWFIFDTGAGSATVVDRKAAGGLRLTRLGTMPLTSMMGTAACPIERGQTLEIGPVTIRNPHLVEMDMGFLQSAMGKDVAGIIGYELLSRCVTEISLADDTIRLFDPERYAEAMPWQPLHFNQWIPILPGSFPGGKGWFRIDLGASGGAGGNVLFHAPVVQRLGLLDDRQTTKAKIGSTRVAIGKIDWFELAGHRFEKPDAIFAIDANGPFGDQYLEGNLGVSFLKPFRIVLDYSRERIALLPRSPDTNGSSK